MLLGGNTVLPVGLEIQNAAEGSGNALSTRERSGKGTGLDVEKAYTSRLCHKRFCDLVRVISLPRRGVSSVKCREMDGVIENLSI